MSPVLRVRLRTLLWFVCLFLPLVWVLPWWLQRLTGDPFAWEGSVWQWLGIWLLLDGVGLAGWCVNLFNVVGRGTPVPFDPPTHFVATGPYRFVRNPMMVGAFLILGGEAALYQSSAVLVYTVCLMTAATLFVRYWEEPDLERRFGPTYLEYKRQVPRWIPRPISRARPSRPR